MKLLILISILLHCSLFVFAKNGDTLHVVPFQKVKIYTDPSDGVNEFSQWGVFPVKSVSYRKIILNVTFQCPDNLHCGEWDYAGHIRIKNTKDTIGNNVEIARMMTPYGWYFNGQWKYTWSTEITDFSPFLHDSVEIEYEHSGFENKDDRGWLVTLDFAIIEGTPPVVYQGMEKLWNGNFRYGDSLVPIDAFLVPMTFKKSSKAQMGRIKIIQSGHGMDSKGNCAEFCPKERTIYYNNQVLNRRMIWKKCGDNPLYPQAGTWIYPRANWCPGSLVDPEDFDFSLGKSMDFTVNMDMEPYFNQNENPAHYSISSYLFYYSNPSLKNDVELVEITRPNNNDAHSRANPICSNPVIKIRNNGSKPLKEVEITFGFENGLQLRHHWKGNLSFNDTTSIALQDILFPENNTERFFVRLEKPNGKRDQYPLDNQSSVSFQLPDVLPQDFIVEVLTNDSSQCLNYHIKSRFGTNKVSHPLGSLSPKTFYRDTLHLDNDCYQFFFQDTLDVGLEFWAMPEAGYGYIRFFDLAGNLIKTFNSDFGSFEYFQFQANNQKFKLPEIDYPLATIYPRLNNGIFHLDYLGAQAEAVSIEIEDPSNGKIVYFQSFENLKSGYLPINIQALSLPKNRYILYIKSKNKTIKRSFRIAE